MYRVIFLRPKYTIPLDSFEVKNGLCDIPPWCVSQTLFVRAVVFLRFLVRFSHSMFETGDCLDFYRLLQVTEMDSGAESTYLF
jgi:hypothetical protein